MAVVVAGDRTKPEAYRCSCAALGELPNRPIKAGFTLNPPVPT